jgi:aryl-phospho-beta-D-glucosidase BglC (GH1 family)
MGRNTSGPTAIWPWDSGVAGIAFNRCGVVRVRVGRLAREHSPQGLILFFLRGIMKYRTHAPRARVGSYVLAGFIAAGGSFGGAAIASAAPIVKVSGNHLVDGSGNTLQLRGVNVSGLEFVAVQGWDPGNPWGNQTGDATPNFNAIKNWKANVVRLPLNEASWLGLTCKDATGASRKADPGGNYQATVEKTVSAATAAGLYVILDLHWSAPGTACPLAQNQMADADHSIAFWGSVASKFKSSPNVMFELFNEPYVGGTFEWSDIMKGGTMTNYVTGGSPWQVNTTWAAAGMQQLLNAVRATGARNVVLVGTANWSQDLSGWVANKPTDPAHQMAAAWHPYPSSTSVGDPQAALPNFGSVAYTWAQEILDAGFPLVISETGDHNANGTVGAPLLANLLPWADARSVSYLGWTWDVWGDSDNVLIKDAAGDPTDGYGVYFKQHLTCVAANNCSSTSTPPPPPPSPVPPPGGTGSAGSAFWVYRNGVFSWGGDYSSNATPNYKSTAGNPETGSYDISVAVTGAWGLWQPYAGGTVPTWDFNAAGYNYLTLDLKPTVTGQVWHLYFMQVGDKLIIGPNGGAEVVDVSKYGPAPVVGKWATYKIPLSAVLTQHSTGSAVLVTGVYKFAIQDQTGRSRNTWYVDNVGFIK